MKQEIIDTLLNQLSDLKGITFDAKSLGQRGVGDKIEDFINQKIGELDSPNFQVIKARSKRSIEDICVKTEGVTIYIDTKSHDLNGMFCMPNLISIDRLRKWLHENNELFYVFVDYQINNDEVTLIDVYVRPIETLDWSALAIQNLGKGQLQIKNAHNELPVFRGSREEWLQILRERALAFYDNQVVKIGRLKVSWT